MSQKKVGKLLPHLLKYYIKLTGGIIASFSLFVITMDSVWISPRPAELATPLNLRGEIDFFKTFVDFEIVSSQILVDILNLDRKMS